MSTNYRSGKQVQRLMDEMEEAIGEDKSFDEPLDITPLPADTMEIDSDQYRQDTQAFLAQFKPTPQKCLLYEKIYDEELGEVFDCVTEIDSPTLSTRAVFKAVMPFGSYRGEGCLTSEDKEEMRRYRDPGPSPTSD